MATLRWLANRYLRIDPRSLGLFRILFGLVLMIDLCQRWRWIAAFYSNDGVLPNHAHLFQLRESGRVFSVFHAFSLRDETFAAFCGTLAFYVFFTLGWHTRVFAIASAVALVSLSGRNLLMNGIGDSLAISLLLVSVFLPLGARFSLDSLRHSFRATEERTANDLNDRTTPSPIEVGPSLGALVLVLVVGIVPLAAALQQKGGAWVRGDALYYALRSDRWISAVGELVRNKAPIGMLAAWSKVFRVCEFAVLPLLLVPVARRVARPIAGVALGVVGATCAVCFNYGPYGWSLLAAVALLIPEETWDSWALRGRYPLRVVYDDDCGMCLWLARLLKRLDARGNVSFIPNGAVSDGLADLPESVTVEMTERSIVVLDPSGRPHEDALALSHVFRALPCGRVVGHAIALPGLRHIVAALYRRVANRRFDISVACGLGSCGVERHDASAPASSAANAGVFPPATRIHRGVRTALATLLVGFVFATFLAATDAGNNLPIRSGLGSKQTLLGAASYARLTAPWGLWSPEPALRNEALVTVATTREDKELDVLTGLPPDLELAAPRDHRLGALWAAYSENIRHDDGGKFRQELRRYLTRGGKIADDQEQPTSINKLKAFWVSAPIAAPGLASVGEIERVDILDSAVMPRAASSGDASYGRGPSMRRELRPLR